MLVAYSKGRSLGFDMTFFQSFKINIQLRSIFPKTIARNAIPATPAALCTGFHAGAYGHSGGVSTGAAGFLRVHFLHAKPCSSCMHHYLYSSMCRKSLVLRQKNPHRMAGMCRSCAQCLNAEPYRPSVCFSHPGAGGGVAVAGSG